MATVVDPIWTVSRSQATGVGYSAASTCKWYARLAEQPAGIVTDWASE